MLEHERDLSNPICLRTAKPVFPGNTSCSYSLPVGLDGGAVRGRLGSGVDVECGEDFVVIGILDTFITYRLIWVRKG